MLVGPCQAQVDITHVNDLQSMISRFIFTTSSEHEYSGCPEQPGHGVA